MLLPTELRTIARPAAQLPGELAGAGWPVEGVLGPPMADRPGRVRGIPASLSLERKHCLIRRYDDTARVVTVTFRGLSLVLLLHM